MSEAGELRAPLPQWLRLCIVLALGGTVPWLLAPLSAAAGVPLLGTVVAALAIIGFAVLQPPALPWRPVRAARVLLVYLPVAVLWVAFAAGYLRAMAALGQPVPPQPALEQAAQAGFGAAVLPIALGAVLLAPVTEELLFRGYLLGVLQRAMPGWPAQLLTAACFGYIHGPGYALPIGVLGLFFGWLRLRHGSLWPSILAHAVHNALVLGVTVAWPGSLDLMYPR